MGKPKVLIADAHKLTCEGIKSILSSNPNVHLLPEVINSTELQNKLSVLNPDIVIIDCFIQGHFTIDDIAYIRRNLPHVRLMIISTNKSKQDVLKVLDYGVNSYLLKECDENEIINALNASVKNEKFFCGRVMDAILEKVTHKCSLDSFCNHCQAVTLGEREEEVIRLIADGLTTKEIADKLNLSFYTISTHRKNIFKKLRIRNSSELIGYALKNGIITAPVE